MPTNDTSVVERPTLNNNPAIQTFTWHKLYARQCLVANYHETVWAKFLLLGEQVLSCPDLLISL